MNVKLKVYVKWHNEITMFWLNGKKHFFNCYNCVNNYLIKLVNIIFIVIIIKLYYTLFIIRWDMTFVFFGAKKANLSA